MSLSAPLGAAHTHTHHAAFLPYICIYIIYIYITDHTQAQTRENPQCLGVQQDCGQGTCIYISTLEAQEFNSSDGAEQGHGSEERTESQRSSVLV